jgi:recombination protein RecA
MKTEEIKRRLRHRKEDRSMKASDFVSTGSSMLNLACTDNPDHGFAKGYYYLLVGTSQSGKTFLSLTCLAEASQNTNFQDHQFIYDDVERGALMDFGKFFGEAVQQRLKVIHSHTVEEFYYRLDNLARKSKPFIYVLDSMDALTSKAELKKFSQQKKAHLEEREVAGSYGDGKAKINSQSLRCVINPLQETGSILIIINQTRDKLTGFGGKTRSGGNALQFYACLEIWSDVKKHISKVYKGKPRSQGVLCTLRVRKNRFRGKDRTIEMPIYYSYGIDDVGSCIDYLLSEKHWNKRKGKIIAPEFDFEGNRGKLIHLISNNSMEKDLGMIVKDTWQDIEQAVSLKRKPRYE